MVESTQDTISEINTKMNGAFEESHAQVLKSSDQIEAYRPKKAKQGKKLTIHTANGAHGKPLIDRLISQGGQSWQHVLLPKNSTLFWAHHHTTDEDLVTFLNGGSDKMTARYPNIRGIDYKDTFGQAMKFAVS